MTRAAKSASRTALIVGASVMLAIGMILGSLRLGFWNPSYASVKADYAGPPSKFIAVGPATIHVRDEGRGPVLVMMHSSMTNLREWDQWAELLRQHYRVIRLDWPPYGLSIDPGDHYSMSNAERLLERFVDQLGLGHFTLVGSSSGATICVLYAAAHPERVDALALSTLPLAAPPPSHIDPRLSVMGWLHRWFFPDYFPREYYKALLETTFADARKITPQMIDWYFASNNIPGAQRHIAAYLQADLKSIWKDTGHGAAARVTAPVLLQWGDADPVLPAYLAEDAKSRLEHAAVTVIHYADAGHYPMLEIPQRSEADLETFLTGIYPPPATLRPAPP